MYYVNMDCPIDVEDGHIVRNQWVEVGENVYECSRCGERITTPDIASYDICPNCNRRIGVRGYEINTQEGING